MAAVLAGGDRALLGYESAAQLWGLARGRLRPIHVVVARNGGRKDRGLCFHHPRSIDDEDRAIEAGIPVTTVARTLLDAGPRLDAAKLFEAAIRQELLDPQALARLLERSKGRRGAGALGRLLVEELHLPDDTRAGIETEFAAFLRARRLPLPGFNVLVAGHLMDAYWPKYGLVAELQSRAFHSTWQAQERDAERFAHLQALDYRVLSITARMLRGNPDELERTLRALMANAEGPRDGGPSTTIGWREAA